MFNGRWEQKLQIDQNGNIFLDFNPLLFRHLLDQLQIIIETEHLINIHPPSQPSLVEPFKKMLRKLGLHQLLPLEQKNIITFNVGGQIITNQRRTFTHVSNSTSDTIIAPSKTTNFNHESDVFLDYNPKIFQHLIKQLREESFKNISYLESSSNKERISFGIMLFDLKIYSPMCTPFWKMPSSDQGTYLTYVNANTRISGDLSRTGCASFRAGALNADQIIFSIGSSLTTWTKGGAGCNTHFTLTIKNASHVNIYGMCPQYDNGYIPVGQSILYDGAFHQICVTYDHTVSKLCVYLDLQSPNCIIRSNVPYSTGLGDVRIGWWPDENRQFDASSGGLIRSVSLFDRSIHSWCVADQYLFNNIG